MPVFLIIFGTRGVTYKHQEGQFACPRCGQQGYKHKRVRRFFTLYFIPLIPLDLLGEYVECDNCKESYRMEVLEFDPSGGDDEFESEFRTAIRKTMVLVCLADNVVDDNEITAIKAVYNKLADADLTEEDIRAEVEQAKSESRDVNTYLSSVAGALNEHGKEMVLKSALLVAAADGEFQDEEQQMMLEIGEALNMTGAHVKGVISEVMAG